MSKVTKGVNATKMLDPKFLTLTGRPANQIAFKIVRDDQGEEVMQPHLQRKRTRRADPLLKIVFEEGMTEEGVEEVMKEYGIEGYSVVTENERLVAMRSDVAEGTATISVGIGGGRSAVILKPISQSETEQNNKLSVVRMEFSNEYFPEKAEIIEWLQRHSVDFSENAMENDEQVTRIVRNAVPDTTDTRVIEVDSGVRFVVARSDTTDVPDNFLVVVNDTAYGSWGWGQLDFTATLADVEFCEAANEASYLLRDVTDRILYYGEMTPSVRKVLLENAAMQYATYLGGLLDALPTRVAIAARSISKKESTVPEPITEIKREDVAPVEAAVEAEVVAEAAAPVEAAPTDAVTRADIAQMIGEAIAGLSAQIASMQPAAPAVEQVERSEPAVEAAEPDPTLTALETIARSIADVSARLGRVEGGVVLRSDGSDQSQAEKPDVFKGVFSGKKA